jgi:hypothetical protein
MIYYIMPFKRVNSTNQSQARGITYDLRRVNMPHEEPHSPAPGKKAKRPYVPRKTSQAIAAFRNEVKKRLYPRIMAETWWRGSKLGT